MMRRNGTGLQRFCSNPGPMLAALVLLSVAVSADRGDDAFRDAEKAYLNGNYQSAARLYRRASQFIIRRTVRNPTTGWQQRMCHLRIAAIGRRNRSTQNVWASRRGKRQKVQSPQRVLPGIYEALNTLPKAPTHTPWKDPYKLGLSLYKEKYGKAAPRWASRRRFYNKAMQHTLRGAWREKSDADFFACFINMKVKERTKLDNQKATAKRKRAAAYAKFDEHRRKHHFPTKKFYDQFKTFMEKPKADRMRDMLVEWRAMTLEDFQYPKGDDWEFLWCGKNRRAQKLLNMWMRCPMYMRVPAYGFPGDPHPPKASTSVRGPGSSNCQESLSSSQVRHPPRGFSGYPSLSAGRQPSRWPRKAHSDYPRVGAPSSSRYHTPTGSGPMASGRNTIRGRA